MMKKFVGRIKHLWSGTGMLCLAAVVLMAWVCCLYARDPLVSVVMPVYNRQKFVGRAIDSILNQTYKHFEFIIVDDGSTDDTPAILKSYADKDPRIKILTNRRNKGISYSRQRGLDAARGKYVAPMDSDDWSVPERLEKTVAFMEDYPDVAAVSGEVFEFYNDKFPRQVYAREKIRQPYQVKHDIGYYEIDLAFDNLFQNIASLVRRDFVKKNNIRYDLNLQSAEDYDFWVQIVLAGGRLASLSNTLAYVRRHATNSKAYYKEMVSNSIRIRKKIFELFFSPAKEDLKFNLNPLDKCLILKKIDNSNRKNTVIPKEFFAERYALSCPESLDGVLYLKHRNWNDFLVPVGNGKYHRFYANDPCSVEFKNKEIIVHWDDWGTETFKKKDPRTFICEELSESRM